MSQDSSGKDTALDRCCIGCSEGGIGPRHVIHATRLYLSARTDLGCQQEVWLRDVRDLLLNGQAFVRTQWSDSIKDCKNDHR